MRERSQLYFRMKDKIRALKKKENLLKTNPNA